MLVLLPLFCFYISFWVIILVFGAVFLTFWSFTTLSPFPFFQTDYGVLRIETGGEVKRVWLAMGLESGRYGDVQSGLPVFEII